MGFPFSGCIYAMDAGWSLSATCGGDDALQVASTNTLRGADMSANSAATTNKRYPADGTDERLMGGVCYEDEAQQVRHLALEQISKSKMLALKSSSLSPPPCSEHSIKTAWSPRVLTP